MPAIAIREMDGSRPAGDGSGLRVRRANRLHSRPRSAHHLSGPGPRRECDRLRSRRSARWCGTLRPNARPGRTSSCAGISRSPASRTLRLRENAHRSASAIPACSTSFNSARRVMYVGIRLRVPRPRGANWPRPHPRRGNQSRLEASCRFQGAATDVVASHSCAGSSPSAFPDSAQPLRPRQSSERSS